MIKICTVYFDGIYTPDYVSKLYRSLKSNTSLPFEFICLSDTDVEADVVLPYNKHSNIKLHWHKLKFFSSQFAYQKPGDEIIIMDIDQIITGNIDELIGFPVTDNEFVTYGTWWPRNITANGGFYKFKSGQFDYIWNDFSLNPEYWQTHYYDNGDVHYKYYGEQNYVNWKIKYERTVGPCYLGLYYLRHLVRGGHVLEDLWVMRRRILALGAVSHEQKGQPQAQDHHSL